MAGADSRPLVARVLRAGLALLASLASVVLVAGVGHHAVNLFAPPRVGLEAQYFADDAWHGAPALTLIDEAPTLARVDRNAVPVTANRFSVRWRGALEVFDAGTYELDGNFDDVLAIDIDGRRAFGTAMLGLAQRGRSVVELGRGLHAIDIRYANRGGAYRLELDIAPRSKPLVGALAPVFRPPGARRATRPLEIALRRVDGALTPIGLATALAWLVLAWPDQRAVADRMRRWRGAQRLLRAPTLHGTLLALACGAVLLRGLGSMPVSRKDEDIHTRVAMEAADSGVFWPLAYRGGPYTHKPPLKLWLSAATLRWVGRSEVWVRIWDASFAALTVLATYWFGRLEWGAAAGSIGAALLLAAPGYVFQHCARDGVQDSAMILGITLALALGSRSPLTRWRAIGTALALTGASLTKTAMGLAPLSILIAQRVLSGNWRELKSPRFLAVVCAGIAAPLGWEIVGFRSIPGFVDQSVGGELVGRFTGDTAPYYVQPWSYYLQTLPVTFGRAWPLAVTAVAWLAVRTIRRRDPRAALLLAWVVVPLTVFSCAHLKLPWYGYPTFPALGIATGGLLVAAVTRFGSRVRERTPALIAVAIGCIAVFVMADVAAAARHSATPALPIQPKTWFEFLEAPAHQSWRIAWVGIDADRDLDDPTFYYLDRLRDRTTVVSSEAELAVLLDGSPEAPDHPTVAILPPAAAVSAELAARAAGRFLLPTPYQDPLQVLAFGRVDPASIPLLRIWPDAAAEPYSAP